MTEEQIEFERDEFEDWARENTTLCLVETWHGYVMAPTRSAWAAWQARAEKQETQ